jgi:hypothetical protein
VWNKGEERLSWDREGAGEGGSPPSRWPHPLATFLADLRTSTRRFCGPKKEGLGTETGNVDPGRANVHFKRQDSNLGSQEVRAARCHSLPHKAHTWAGWESKREMLRGTGSKWQLIHPQMGTRRE